MSPEEREAIKALLAPIANTVSQLHSAVDTLVRVVGVVEPGGLSLAGQVRDLRERVANAEGRLASVEAVAAGARESADRTHALLLNEANELGATDKVQQAKLDELDEELNGIAQRESQRAAGASGE